MSIAIVTGAGGLIGSAAVRRFAALGLDVIGIDNNGRGQYFGNGASVAPTLVELARLRSFRLRPVDIRNRSAILDIWAHYGRHIEVIVHAAAQPSHDWAAADPLTDFDVNAVGTLNVLEATRRHAAEAVLIHCSTNKVYGDLAGLPLIEYETRLEVDHQMTGGFLADGIDEEFPIDQTMHSVFGAGKLSADIMAQEYARYYGLYVGVFRAGCLTGPGHHGAELHGFLAYLMHRVASRLPYRVIGYGGKQVRDNLHAHDVVAAFEQFWRDPRRGEVYNLGGGRGNSVSVLEALELAEQTTGRVAKVEMDPEPRRGDHRWWITDTAKFRAHYPEWTQAYDLPRIMSELAERWLP